MKALVVSYLYYESTIDYVHGMPSRMSALVIKRNGKNVAILTKDGCAFVYQGDFKLRDKGNKTLGEVEIEDSLIEQVEAASAVQKQLTESIKNYIEAVV